MESRDRIFMEDALTKKRISVIRITICIFERGQFIGASLRRFLNHLVGFHKI